MRSAALLALLGLVSACEEYVPLALPLDEGARENWVELRTEQRLKTEVDVLFVVDDSGSMSPKVEALKQRFSTLVETFSEFAAKGQAASYHFGVVTTDLGAPGISCGSNLGARLQRVGLARTRPEGCEGPVGARYITFDQRSGLHNLPGAQTLAETFACMASVVDPDGTPGGHTGCGFEMPLEAAYRALHDPIAENQGFLRPDSVLAVVFLTDEDDCSADADSDVFTANPLYGPLNSFRCARYGVICDGALVSDTPQASYASCVPATAAQGGKLTDVGKYIRFFSSPASQGGVRANPRDVVLASISAPALPFGTQTATGNQLCGQGVSTCTVLSASCSAADNAAFMTGNPAVRLNAVFAAAKTYSGASICESDYRSAVQQIGTRIVTTMLPSCLPRPLPDPAQPNCVVEDRAIVDGIEQKGTSIPRCSQSSGAFPCWRMMERPECPEICDPEAGRHQQLAVSIDRGGAQAAQDTIAYVSCEVQPLRADAEAACSVDLGAPDL